MHRIKNFIICLVSLIIGAIFLYISFTMAQKLGLSMFLDDGNPFFTGHRRWDSLSEFVIMFLVGIAGIINGLLYAYLVYKNKNHDYD